MIKQRRKLKFAFMAIAFLLIFAAAFFNLSLVSKAAPFGFDSGIQYIKSGNKVVFSFSGKMDYNDEKYTMEIHEGSKDGQIIASANGSIWSLNGRYTQRVSWDTTGIPVGRYYAVLDTQFYSLGEWHSYPYKDFTIVDIIAYDVINEAEKIEGFNAMYRMYNPNSGEHFYTADLSEANGLSAAGWNYEGVAWYAPETGSPVYRLYNPNAGDHHYTTNWAEKNMLASLGWKDEGIGWYSSESGTALLRLYNPNATGAGAHHYTTDTSEKNNLISNGWKDEGVGWYGR